MDAVPHKIFDVALWLFHRPRNERCPRWIAGGHQLVYRALVSLVSLSAYPHFFEALLNKHSKISTGSSVLPCVCVRACAFVHVLK